MKRRIRLAPLLLCATIGLSPRPADATSSSSATTTAAPSATAGCDRGDQRRTCATRLRRGHRRSGGTSKIGFITKFPVDFYDTMVDAAKAWNEDHPEVRADLRPGHERHRRRGRDRGDRVDGHPGRQGDRDHPDQPERAGRAAEGRRRRHQGDPRRQRHPRLGRQDVARRHRQPRRRHARRRVHRPSS